MARRNKILVPEARNGLDALKAKVVQAQNPENAKFEAAEEVGVPLKKGYNGQLTSSKLVKLAADSAAAWSESLSKWHRKT